MTCKAKFISLHILSIILLISLFLSACGSGADSSSVGETLLKDRCTSCHTLNRIEKVVKTRDEWTRTVDRMIAMGAELSSDERLTVIDFLEATYSQ